MFRRNVIVSVFFSLVLVATIAIWVVGLIQPSKVLRWGKKRTRGRLSLICAVIVIFSIGMIGEFEDPVENTDTNENIIATADYNAVKDDDSLLQIENLDEDENTKDKESISNSQAKDDNQSNEQTEFNDSNEVLNIDTNVQADRNESANTPNQPTGELKVHFIDVGQGDSTLLQFEDITMLIDAGRHDRSDVVPYLRSVGITEIDIFVLTHPHADHIGQADKVINTFEVREVWASGNVHTSKTFERMLDAILDSEANYVEPQAGEEYDVGSAKIRILHPDKLTGNLNDDSISMHLQYGDIGFVFTGDAEKAAESKMIRSGLLLKAEILHVGHHGSNTSSTQAFLEAVNPDIAIYSAGIDNSYGHPHAEVIKRLKDMKITIYGTDTHGSVIVTTDGKTYSVKTAKKGDVAIAPVTSQPKAEPEPVDAKDLPASQPDPKPTDEPKPAQPAQTVNSCGTGTVNINTANVEELQRIKHIGEVRAKEIIELRKNREFKSVDDLTRVKGIAASRLKDIKEQGIACVG